MRVAYLDPPYPGMSGFYKDHPDYGGEVDHAELIERVERDYDAWVLHTASTTLKSVLAVCPDGVRVMAWCKSFASFKKNVRVAYAWEPVIVKGGRPRPEGAVTVRDWTACPITLQRGLVGVKPDPVCHWLFEVLGMEPTDDLDDVFPGSGAVARAWEMWRSQLRLETA